MNRSPVARSRAFVLVRRANRKQPPPERSSRGLGDPMELVSLFVPFFVLKVVMKLKYPDSFMMTRLFHAIIRHHNHPS